MSSDSATSIASQQSIKTYVDNEIDTEMDLVFTTDSGNGQITMDSETLTLAGGTGIDSVGSGNTLTFNIDKYSFYTSWIRYIYKQDFDKCYTYKSCFEYCCEWYCCT